MPLTPAENELAATIGFDPDVCDVVKRQTGGTLDRLTILTEDFEQRQADGLSVEVGRDEIERMIAFIQPQISQKGYRAFWSDTHESNGLKKSDVIAVLKTNDPYAILSVQGTAGMNYDVSFEDVVQKLKEWERRCRFQIIGAAGDWVALQFESLPDDICAFAEEIYEFCPNTAEQEMVDFINDLKQSRQLYLWWD